MSRTAIFIVVLAMFIGAAKAQGVSDAEFKKLNDELTQNYSKGDYEKALVAAERLVEIAERQYGKEHLVTGKALKNRAAVENAKGDVKRAQKTFEDAIDIFKKQKDLSKADGASLADMLERVGVMRAKDELMWTEGIFKQALEWRERSNGPDAVETATPLVQLANINFWRREFKKSAELYGRALTNLGKSDSASKEDVTFVYHRTLCSYRKAKIEDEFASMKESYEARARSEVVQTRRARLIIGGVVNGKAVHLEKPAYPAEARRANADGIVKVEVLINEEGNVISACVAAESTQHIALVEVSEIAAYKSKFSQTRLDGAPVKVSGVIMYNFKR